MKLFVCVVLCLSVLATVRSGENIFAYLFNKLTVLRKIFLK